jgi:hypothetical protein
MEEQMSPLFYPEKDSWDWDPSSREISNIDQWKADFNEVQEFVVSPDGQKVAAVVQNEDETFTPCINGETWENSFEKAWSLKFSPDGRLFCLGMNDDEWTIIEDDRPWEDSFEYVWNLKFSQNGKGAGANIRTSDGYGFC